MLKDFKEKRKNQVCEVSPNEAFGLIDSGYASVTKDMTSDDYQQAENKNGSTTQLRSNKPK